MDAVPEERLLAALQDAVPAEERRDEKVKKVHVSEAFVTLWKACEQG